MKNLAVVYHSGYGHTKALAQSVLKGASIEGVEATLINVEDIEDVAQLDKFDAMVFGTPTYMGSVSGKFKMFMDKTAGAWFNRNWQNKIAAGFTNSGSLAGDKFNTLVQLATFAAQHGMIWVGQNEMNESSAEDKTSGQADSINRAGSYLGLTAQSDHGEPSVTPPAGDHKTAEAFGKRIAQATLRWN
tara:strand:- start:1471 stop:2034 length:564 start_codon:yes stop_codon:yes gene_type:complete